MHFGVEMIGPAHDKGYLSLETLVTARIPHVGHD